MRCIVCIVVLCVCFSPSCQSRRCGECVVCVLCCVCEEVKEFLWCPILHLLGFTLNVSISPKITTTLSQAPQNHHTKSHQSIQAPQSCCTHQRCTHTTHDAVTHYAPHTRPNSTLDRAIQRAHMYPCASPDHQTQAPPNTRMPCIHHLTLHLQL